MDVWRLGRLFEDLVEPAHHGYSVSPGMFKVNTGLALLVQNQHKTLIKPSERTMEVHVTDVTETESLSQYGVTPKP